METCRLSLEHHHALPLAAQIVEHLGEHVLKIALMNRARGVGADEIAPAEVESRAELMGGTVGGIDVTPAQRLHGGGGAQQARHFYLIAVHSALRERVDEVVAHLREQVGGLRHEKGEGVGELVHAVGFARLDFHQRAGSAVSVGEGAYGRDAYAFRPGILVLVAVEKELPQIAEVTHVYPVVMPGAGWDRRSLGRYV